MTSQRIWHTGKPLSRGPILPMTEDDRRAWEITRERHPQYYSKEKTK